MRKKFMDNKTGNYAQTALIFESAFRFGTSEAKPAIVADISYFDIDSLLYIFGNNRSYGYLVVDTLGDKKTLLAVFDGRIEAAYLMDEKKQEAINGIRALEEVVKSTMISNEPQGQFAFYPGNYSKEIVKNLPVSLDNFKLHQFVAELEEKLARNIGV
jgi:hypothetical protein